MQQDAQIEYQSLMLKHRDGFQNVESFFRVNSADFSRSLLHLVAVKCLFICWDKGGADRVHADDKVTCILFIMKQE